MPGLDPQVFLTPGSIAAAIETTVANIDSPTELNSLGTSQGELRIARTAQAGDSNETLYYLDTTSSAQSLPYIVTSATAGLKWLAMAGYAHNQLLKLSAASVNTLVSALGNINDYSEINIRNANASSSASSDLVATADNGTSTTHYVDLGINGSTGGQAPFTIANHAYVYTVENNLNVGATGATGAVNVAVGATPTIVAVFDITNGVTFNDKTTISKQFRYQIANQTAATIFTFDTGAQTVSRTLSVPVLGGNDTIETLATTQTVTGAKTFSAITTVSNTTSASAANVGALVVGNGAAATSVAMGAGKLRVGGDIQGDAIIYGTTAIIALGANSYFDAIGSNPYFNLGGSGAASKPSGLAYGFYAKSGVGIAYVSSNNGAIDFEDQSGTVLVQVRNTRVTMTVPLTIASAVLMTTTTAFTNGAGAALGTLTNAPVAGNPTKWISVNDNGTTRWIPSW